MFNFAAERETNYI